MAAPKGNEFWRLRLQHGQLPKIQDPNWFTEKALEYFDNLEENHFTEVDFRGKDAIEVHLPKVRIPSKQDFALFCGFSEWRSVSEYADRQEFAQIITRIEKTIETAQLQYASAGFAKENIVARVLGLADKKEIELPKKIKVGFSKPEATETED